MAAANSSESHTIRIAAVGDLIPQAPLIIGSTEADRPERIAIRPSSMGDSLHPAASGMGSSFTNAGFARSYVSYSALTDAISPDFARTTVPIANWIRFAATAATAAAAATSAAATTAATAAVPSTSSTGICPRRHSTSATRSCTGIGAKYTIAGIARSNVSYSVLRVATSPDFARTTVSIATWPKP